jgi:hypothetical protein
MIVSPRFTGCRALALAGVLTLAASAASGQDRAAPAPSRLVARDTVDVELKIVPFYAADARGNPVYDLRPDEVELRVGGSPVPVESFDRSVIPSGRSGAEASPLTPTPARTVFFLFDKAFSTPAGFKTDQRLAARLVAGWPAGDRLFVIAHGVRPGLERKLGPVPPDAEGKKELLAAIEALPLETLRVERWQDETAGQYRGAAWDLASSLGDLAAELRRIPGPKLLLLFSQGFDESLYFKEGGPGDEIQIDPWRARGLVDRFREPLAALAEAGAMTLFVNADRNPRGFETGGDAVLRQMAKTTGGLYLEGTDPRDLETRIAGSTTAYYEAGFRPAGPLLQTARAGVEVSVRRPGVRVWAPASVRTRESYRTLSAFEKRRMVIDLVAGGAAAQHAHGNARLGLHFLTGKTVGVAKSGRPVLRFDADWPPDLAGHKLDLYNVVLALPGGGQKGKVLQFEERDAVPAVDRELLEAPLEKQFSQVWGIVAVDPESERIWTCRLMIKPPGEAAK